MSTYKERYEERKKQREEQGNSFQDRYFARKIKSGELDIQAVGKDISNRVNTWLENNNNYFSNAQSRFSGENTSFRSDASDWLTTVTTQRENFAKEAENIKTTLNLYKSFFDADYVNSVFEALDGNLKAQDNVIKAATQDLDFWSQFESEDEYNRLVRINGYQKKYMGKSYEAILANINALSDGEEKEWLNSNKYWLLPSASDFADKSQYKTTYRGGEVFNAWSGMYTDTGYDDIAYDYINRDETAMKRQHLTDIQTNAALLGLDDSERKEMSDEEISIFNYLYATQDSDTAYEYINNLTSDLNARQRASEEAFWAEYASQNPVASSVFSVLESPLKGISYLGQFADYAGDGTIDQNAEYNKFSYINSAIRNEVSANVEEKWGSAGSFAYQTGMSMGDFLFTTAVTGGSQGLALAVMGSGAAADSTVAAKDRGLSDDQAFMLGTVAGVAEVAMEEIGLDALFNTDLLSKSAVKYVINNALLEGFEEVGTDVINTIADIVIAQDKSQWQTAIDFYMSQGKNESEAFGLALADKAKEMGLSFLGGAISGGVLGGVGTVAKAAGNAIQGAEMKKAYGADIGTHLTTEALQIDANNPFAQRMQSKLDSGKALSIRQIGKLVQQNEVAMYNNDIAAIQNAAESRLTELGERGDVKTLANALAKQASGENLSFREKNAIKNSKFGQRVANELNADNIKSGEYSSAWAENIGTDRINAEEYSRLIQRMEAEDNAKAATAEAPAKALSEVNAVETVEPSTEVVEPESVAMQENAGTAEIARVAENATEATTASTNIINADESTVTLESASKKYGAQAGAMISTYTEGQDVAQYDTAYKAAYDMGNSGVTLSYAMNSELTQYLTENQRKLAYAAGADASSITAKAQDAENKSKANGKTERKKGTVRGDGVTISDIKNAVNDKQGVAYKLLSTYAEATGIDIVLYKSKTNADGEFEGGQGKFKWSEDTIYIDINAGLANVNDVDELAKYTMMRTFAHEFTHFIEKWNPVQYNEFRKVVFDTLTERGENVDEFITSKMAQDASGEMTYDEASREVVAEAMTDILPNANFVEKLAANHKTIFNKLLEKLKEFVSELKTHFNSLLNNRSREANALKEQVGESVKYVESIVKLFDKVAVEAVENYQLTAKIENKTKNTDGGIENVGQQTEQNERSESVHAGRNSNLESAQDGTREEDGNRPRVQGLVGEKDEIVQEDDSVQRQHTRIKDTADNAWLLDSNNYITPAQGSDLHKAQSTLADEYGIECHIVKDSAWKRKAKASTHYEKVYICESIDEVDLRATPYHEATHAIKQRGFKPYLDFIGRTPDMLNAKSQDYADLMNMVAEHLGYDILNMNEHQLIRFYDELNATIYGWTASRLIFEAKYDAERFTNAFSDFDAYKNELSSIHEQFKKENAQNNGGSTKTYSNEHFTLSDDAVGRVISIKFDGKPVDAVRNVLKNNAFVWNKAKGEWFRSGKWYDKNKVNDVITALQKVYGAPEQSDFEKSFWNATQAERDEVVAAIDANTKISHMAPTEIRGEQTSKTDAEAAKVDYTKQEVKPNVENVDNRSSVQQPVADRQGDTQVLEGLQAEDVSTDAPRGDSVGDSVERGQQTIRDDLRPDAAGVRRGSGEGDSESRDLRRDDVVTDSETDTNVGDKTADVLHKEVEEQIAQQSTEQPKGRNFVIGDSLDLPNGEKSRYKANIEAIRLVKQLEAEKRYATEAEQVILSKYVGWGGLANAFDQRKTEWSKEYTELKELLTKEEYESARGSTLNAHFTDISVIKAMYDGLDSLGFNGGRMLEPSSGVGNFVGAMPAAMTAKVKSWTMVELDGITGLIAKYLYPNSDVRIQGFEKANIPDNYMDVTISNVPFGNYAITDKAYPKKVTSAIHNYFFAKSLDKVRPGGIVMFITSSYTMNSKDSTVRRYIMQRADLLGAIRLPDSAFKGNAGTEVVTDILVLKKRAANTAYAGEDFLEAPWVYPVKGSYNGANINTYFENHPEMVLGTASMDGGMYRGGALTYKAIEGKGSLADQIREAFSHIEGKMEYPATLSREKTNFAVEKASKNTKNDAYVSKDGKIYQNKNGELVEKTVSPKEAERISGMLEIRDAARELMTYQQQGLKDSEVKNARVKLNKLYDAFVKKNGYLNSSANKSAFKEDPDCFSLFALENWNSETKTAKKADIFSKNTIAPNRTVTSAKDVAEGLIVSINQTGGVDTALIARLTGKTETDVARELIDSRQAFKNRNGELETAEVYLSGNVRAKLRDAEALVPMDSDYKNNVEALKSVMPEDVGYQDIFVNPGTPWIPNSVYSDFAAYMLGGRNTEWRQDIDVTRNAETGNFTVELIGRHLKYNAMNTQKWGTSRRTFLDLFDAMLNSKSVVIKDKLDDGSFVINKDATAAANEKIENIQKEFQEWLWKDEARRTELETLYNEVFNSVVTPKYNGDNLTVNGANAEKPLRSHQRNAVQRIIASGGNTLLAHRVGAGKTYEMAAAAMKLKELGLVKKPMFAVPKSLVAQWGVEFKDFFPTAKLLVAEASDFTAANRKVFMNRIANGEYDAVIVSYEQFEKLPMSDDFTRELYQEQINSIIAAIEEAKADKGGKALSVKDLEKKRKSLQTKIDKLTDKAKDEGNIDFEQLGVDSLFIDEAHNFKNLFYTTSMTNVAGLGNKDGSKRAFDLYTKVRYLQQLNGGRGIVFATATPVMNSMSEMYIMQKYLQPDLLDQLGLSTFDAWAKQFGEVVNGVEIKPSGQGYRVKQSFSRFKNMSELQLLFRNFADVLTDIPGLKVPKMKGGKVNVVVCESGEFQQNFMKELEKRADNIKNVDPSEDNMLKITSDGRKISYTQRMIDPSLPYEEGCKIFRCADNVIKEYNDNKDIKGTQLIFLDMATPKGKSDNTTETEDIEMDMENTQLYDDLKARLRQGGIPAKEIAFIHDADTDQKKKKLFADVNDGKVRVLIGSTGKMGVGMNAQKRVVAIHHLDAPWRPGDVEQRDGRAFRQGNINEEVSKYAYVTEGSFDARLWDILERKQNFINQIMNGESVGREAEDTGEVTLSAAEVKALASGSPLILEQVQLDTDIKKLESLHRAHLSAVRSARERLSRNQGMIADLERRIARGKSDIAARVDTYSDNKFSVTIDKSKYTDKKEAGVVLMSEATANAVENEYTTIGKFAGFDIRVLKTKEGIIGLLEGKQSYSFKTYSQNTTFMINHLIATVESIDEKVKLWEHNLAETHADIAEQEKLITEPFAKQAELDQKRARYNEVMAILNPKEEQALDSVDEDKVQEQSRKYLEDEKPKKQSKRSMYSETETQFMFWAYGSTPVGEIKRFVRFGKHHYYEKTEDGCVELSRTQYNERTDFNAEDIDRRAERGIIQITNFDGSSERNAAGINNGDRNAAGTSSVSGQTFGEKLRNDTRRSVSNFGGDDYGDIQEQQRTTTLTDREVLAMAADKLTESELSEAERDALQIFKKRLAKLELLQNERAEQGRLYKEQQFGAKVDRNAAAQTLNRMHVLDEQIKTAKADVLSVEDKTVLGDVLRKARQVVEAEEKKHGAEMLKRWRDRTHNTASIKKYRERIKKDVNELTNWVLKPNNKDIVKHIPDVLKNSVIPFLSSIDFTSKQQLSGREATRADEEFVKRLNALNAALKDNIDINGLYSGYNDLPPNFMEKLQSLINNVQTLVNAKSGEFVINKMTSEELKDLSDVVRNLKAYITQINKFHANAMYQHVYEAGDNSIETLSHMESDNGKSGTAYNFVFWQQIRPAFAFERFGEGGKAIYDGLRRGQAQLAFNTQKIVEFTEKAYTDKEVNAWEKEVKTIQLASGFVKMRVSDMMSFYELSKQPDSLRHMLGEGMRVATYKLNGKKISDNGHALTEGDIKTIVNTLTPRQKEVADAMQKFMQEQGGAWGNYVSIARFGEELFTNEQYFPINSDGRHLQSTADEQPSAASLYALLNMSFTKSRNEKANNRIIVYSIFDVFSNHMASMAQYNAMALPVLDAIKWFNYQQKTEDADGNRYVKDGVREQMARVYGVPEETRPGAGKQSYAETFILNILKAFNGTEAQGVPADTMGMNAIRRYNMAQVAYNFRVVVQQPLAITRAALLMDYGSIMKGLKLTPSAIKQNIDEMRKYSGIAAWKSLGFYDTNISRGLTETIKHSSTLGKKIGDVGMWGAEKADTFAWAAMWSASKEEVIKKQGLTPKSDGFYEEVTKVFEDVIYKTQVVDSVLTKNEFLRSKGTFARLVGSFMSEPTTTASMVIDTVDKFNTDIKRGMTRSQAWEKNKKNIGRTMYVYGVSAVILAAVQAVADAFRDDDDYEEFYEKWLEAFGGNLLDEAMPINKLPILSDFYDLAKELTSIFGVDTYGNPPQSVFMQWWNNLVNGVQIMRDKFSGEDTNYTYYGGIYKLLQAVSGMTGLPMATATREIVTAWNNIVGGMAPSLKVKTYESGDKNEIKYAYQDGYLTFEEAIAELLEQGLVDNEDEAYFTVSGWEAGEGYSRYDVLDTAVRNGVGFDEAVQDLLSHGYTEKDIYSRVQSKASEWYKGGEITKAQAANMLENYTDLESNEIAEKLNKWSSIVVTGIDYDDIDDEFLAGNISDSRAIEMYVRYGSMTQEKATEKVSTLSFVKEHPECEGISYTAVEAYKQHCEPTGMDAGVFYDVWKYSSSISADVDKNGNAISGSKKTKVLDYVNSLELSKKQKNALYYALGYAESKIYEAPWR